MDLSWLEALVVTVEHGSFQTGAQKLGVSRATLRARVEALENHVGLPLLVRTVRGVELTDAGEPFLARARALLAEAVALAQFANERTREVTGELRIRVPVGMPSELHVIALSAIRQRHPGVRIRLEVHADPTVGLGPETDFVLHFCPRITHGDFQTLRLWTAPVRLVASPAYLAERGTPQVLEDLQNHALLTWIAAGEDETRWPLQKGGSIAVNSAVYSADIGTLRGLASAGMGIALVPDAEEMAPIVGHEPLVRVLPEIVGKDVSMWILLPAAHSAARRTRAVVELTKALRDWIAQRAPYPQ